MISAQEYKGGADPGKSPDLPGSEWLQELLPEPLRVVRFFLKLGADSGSRWYGSAIQKLGDVFMPRRSAPDCLHPNLGLISGFITELHECAHHLGSSQDNQLPLNARNLVDGQIGRYPLFALLLEDGRPEAHPILIHIKKVVILARLLAEGDEVDVVDQATRQLFSDLRSPESPSNTISEPRWQATRDRLESALKGNGTIFEVMRCCWDLKRELQTATQKGEENPRSVKLVNALIKLEPVFLPKSSQFDALFEEDAVLLEELVNEPLQDPDDDRLNPLPIPARDIEGQEGLGWLAPSGGADAEAMDEAENAPFTDVVVHIPEDVAPEEAVGLPEYQLNRSIGKLRRALSVNGYSKLLFNPIERALLLEYLTEHPASVDQAIGKATMVLSICTGLPVVGLVSLTIGDQGTICPHGVYRREFDPVVNGARPAEEAEQLFVPVGEVVDLTLPEICRELLRNVGDIAGPTRTFMTYTDRGVSELDQLLVTTVGELRRRHGRRYHPKRVESQLRYFIASETRDMALVDVLFGHGGRGQPIQRAYRQISIARLQSIYRDLAEYYFTAG